MGLRLAGSPTMLMCISFFLPRDSLPVQEVRTKQRTRVKLNIKADAVLVIKDEIKLLVSHSQICEKFCLALLAIFRELFPVDSKFNTIFFGHFYGECSFV